MRIPSDIMARMDELIKDDELKQRIKNGDSEAIIQLGLSSQKTFTAEEIINYNQADNLGELVARSAYLIKLGALYRDLYNMYCLNAIYKEADGDKEAKGYKEK